jgi:hypothetical protein
MATEGAKERTVVIAMDGSEYSDYAFDCKFASPCHKVNKFIVN